MPRIDRLLGSEEEVQSSIHSKIAMPRPSTSDESKLIVIGFVTDFIERLDTEDFILPKKDRYGFLLSLAENMVSPFISDANFINFTRCSPFEVFLKVFPEEVKPQDGGSRPTGVSQVAEPWTRALCVYIIRNRCCFNFEAVFEIILHSCNCIFACLGNMFCVVAVLFFDLC